MGQTGEKAGGGVAGNGLTRRGFLKVSGGSAAAMFALAGCGSVFSSGDSGGGGGGNGGGGSTLNTYIQADIPDLNSTTTTDTYSFSVLANVNEGLYRLDENEEPVPGMAESVEVSEDGLDYTFTLREGIQWSNGDPVTAENFRYAWLRAMNPDTAGQYAYIISDFVEGGSEFAAGEAGEGEVGIQAPDDRTLEVTLANPAPFFLGLTAFPTYFPLEQSFVEGQGEDFGLGPDALLYNGPYTMTEFNASEGVVLEKNPDYWDADNVGLDTVDLRVIKDNDTALNLYEAGELDTVERLSSEQTDAFRDSSEFIEIPEFASFYTILNTEDEVISNENIRRALQLGFDRQGYVDTVLNDASIPAGGVVPEGISGPGDQTFREFAGDEPVGPFDAGQAREYWDQGVEELGREPTLELLASDTTVGRDTATFLQSQYQENLGATVEINVQPFDSALELEQNGNYQIGAATGWGADYDDAMTFLDLWTSESDFNYVGFQNEEYDRLIADAKTESDEEARAEMMVEAERILLEEGAVLAPNYYRVRVGLEKPYVANSVRHPYGAELDFKYWRIER